MFFFNILLKINFKKSHIWFPFCSYIYASKIKKKNTYVRYKMFCF